MISLVISIILSLSVITKATEIRIPIGFVIRSDQDDLFQLAQEYSSAISTDNLKFDCHVFEVENNSSLLQQVDDFVSSKRPAWLFGQFYEDIYKLVENSIPYVEIESNNYRTSCEQDDGRISVLPTTGVLVNALKGFLQHQQHPLCKQFVLLLDDQGAAESFIKSWREMVYSLKVNCETDFPIIVTDLTQLYQVMEKIQRLGLSYIILISNSEAFVKNVFSSAEKLNIVNYLYRWFVLSMDKDVLTSNTLQSINDHGTSVSYTNVIDKSRFLDFNMTIPTSDIAKRSALFDSLLLAQELGQRYATENPSAFVHIKATDMQAMIKNGVRGLNVRGILGEFKELINGCRTSVPIEYYIAQNGENGELTFSKELSLTSPSTVEDLGYQMPKKALPLFSNQPVTVHLYHALPIFLENSTYIDPLYEILQTLSKSLDFDFKVQKLWEPSLKNIPKTDLVIGTFAGEDHKYMDLSEPVLVSVLGFGKAGMFASGGGERPEGFLEMFTSFGKKLLKPFSLEAWLVGLAIFFIGAFLLALVTWVHGENSAIPSSFFTVTAVFFLGTTEKCLTALSARTLLTSLLIFSYVTIASYIANLALSFTQDISMNSISFSSTNTLDDLLYGDLQVGVHSNSAAMHYMKSSIHYPLSEIWNKVQQGVIFNNVNDINLKQESFYLIGDSLELYSRKVNFCRLQLNFLDNHEIHYRIGFPKGLRLKEVFDSEILKLNDNGVLLDIRNRLTSKWRCGIPSMDPGPGNTMTSESVSVLWTFIICGIIVSFIFAVFGSILHLKKKQHAYRP